MQGSPENKGFYVQLSIAIPTHNGAERIRETLDSIVSQLEEGVEILVSDNASTDATAEIVRSFQERYPVIRYICNDEDLGADRNIDLAVIRSHGKYVWLFSDDDVMASGGIRKALEVIDKHGDLAAVFVNWGSYSNDLTQCYLERVVDITEDLLLEDSDAFLLSTGLRPIFISANIVNRQYWVMSNRLRYLDTNWLQFGALLAILPGRSSYCIATPYVSYRSGAPRWKDKDMVHLENNVSLAAILYGLPRGDYGRVSVTKALDALVRTLPATIHNAKSSDLKFSGGMLKRMAVCYRASPFFWTICLPMLLLPGFMHRLLIRSARSMKRILRSAWKKPAAS